ncbi:hypothetical protein E2C01_078958 [Portunus trituberculatus]|uniref:Uncharacterized protein n=1 Tax=Portunus trituberculatus TaxID=210409 RepID=A0A5B7IQ47_PORTR|nr:hypothetical protein [Portunus trituberculatus]
MLQSQRSPKALLPSRDEGAPGHTLLRLPSHHIKPRQKAALPPIIGHYTAQIDHLEETRTCCQRKLPINTSLFCDYFEHQ